MENRIVLVTGGAGYIGSHVCKVLANKGFLPVTYDNLCSGNEEAAKWGPFEKGDVRDRTRLAEVIERYNPASIMHFAALIQVGDSVQNPAFFYDNNVFGSFCLLEEARRHNIRNMVFSSTAAVYGTPIADAIEETHPLRPINPYGNTKLIMENMIRDYSSAYPLNYAILRYFNAAGADPDAQIGPAYKVDTHIIPLLMRVASGIMPEIKVYGTDYNTRDGTAIRDYIHVRDLAEAHVLALRHIMHEKQNLTLNLGTNKGQTVKEIIDAVRAITHHPIPAEQNPRRCGDPDILVANATRAREILKWNPSHSDIETIVNTAWIWRQKQNNFGKAAAFMDMKMDAGESLFNQRLNNRAA
jgi:UDP-glucose-4-epimerase GalE